MVSQPTVDPSLMSALPRVAAYSRPPGWSLAPAGERPHGCWWTQPVSCNGLTDAPQV